MKALSDRIKMNDQTFYKWVLQDAVVKKDKTAVFAGSEVEENGK